MFAHALASALLVLVGSSFAAASEGPPPILQPYSCTSTDGRWSLAVEPTRRDGGGAGRYRCTHDGKLAWEGEKPWTLWEALVTDDGFAAGFAYSAGWRDPRSTGSFHAVILAPDGAVRLDESHPREASRVMHSPPNPLGRGVFEQAGLQRVVFRIADDDPKRNREEWWSFQLPLGELVGRFRPRDAYPDEDKRNLVLAARGVAGTRLTLVEWSTFDWPHIGIALALLDEEHRPVLERAFPDELSDVDDALRTQVYQHGTLLAEPAPRGFALGLPRSKESVRCAVEETAEGWKLRELDRAPWSALPEPASSAGLESVQPVTLEERGSFPLERATLAPNAVHDVLEFACADAGTLRLVRSEDKGASFTLLRVDREGRMLHERGVAIPGRLPKLFVHFWPGPGHSWLATQSQPGEGGHSLAWRVDEEDGSVRALEALACDAIDELAVLEDGGFVALSTRRGRSTMTRQLAAYAADGRQLWRRGEEERDLHAPDSLLSPEALAIRGDGRIAVLDNIRHTLQFFARDGSFASTLDLDAALGHKTNYPSGLQADVEGGLLVHDFNGKPPLVRLDKDGRVTARLTPRFADGRASDGLARRARVAPDGRVWTTDGQRVLRLDADGVVDLELGPHIEAGVLAQPAAGAIDAFGRALVQDGGSGAVHVFDGRGKRLFVCRPDPADFENVVSIARLVATRDGGVVAPAKDGCVRFGPDGARLGRLELGRRELCFSLRTEALFATRYHEGFDELGPDLAPRRSFEHGPEGRWLVCLGGIATAPDGAVAICDGGNQLLAAPLPASLVLFENADPGAARRLALPTGAPLYRLALGRRWAAVSGFEPSVLLVRRSDGRSVRFQVPQAVAGRAVSFGFDPETEELLVLEGFERLRRFAMPADAPR